MIIDATDMIAGRLAAHVAKQLMLGEKIDIINAEKAVISGSKALLLADYSHRRGRGNPNKGPFQPRIPHLILKRIVRGMLPIKKEKGQNAFKLLKCHIGVPAELEGQKIEILKQFHKSKLLKAKTTSIEELAKLIGRK